MTRLCAVEGCGKPKHTKGFCNAHYQRDRRHGNPLGLRVFKGEAIRFVHEVALKHKGDECLIWPYARTKKGYPRVRVNGSTRTASRYVCELAHGKPPTDEHESSHSCGKGHEGCVSAEHLSWKTPVENQADKLIHGTLACGERTGTAKLTEVEVRQIRSMRGKASMSSIARTFNVSTSNIHAILHRKSWAHL